MPTNGSKQQAAHVLTIDRQEAQAAHQQRQSMCGLAAGMARDQRQRESKRDRGGVVDRRTRPAGTIVVQGRVGIGGMVDVLRVTVAVP
jgi:hypothetical protein